MKDGKSVCSGKTFFSLIMSIFYIICSIFALFIPVSDMTGYIFIKIIFILCIILGLYFFMYWYNKKIMCNEDGITYRSIYGKETKYLWKDIYEISYKSGGRSAYRIVIKTHKNISIENNMRNFNEFEKTLKEKGYLNTALERRYT